MRDQTEGKQNPPYNHWQERLCCFAAQMALQDDCKTEATGCMAGVSQQNILTPELHCILEHGSFLDLSGMPVADFHADPWRALSRLPQHPPDLLAVSLQVSAASCRTWPHTVQRTSLRVPGGT